jgi:hypothetical protein
MCSCRRPPKQREEHTCGGLALKRHAHGGCSHRPHRSGTRPDVRRRRARTGRRGSVVVVVVVVRRGGQLNHLDTPPLGRGPIIVQHHRRRCVRSDRAPWRVPHISSPASSPTVGNLRNGAPCAGRVPSTSEAAAAAASPAGAVGSDHRPSASSRTESTWAGVAARMPRTNLRAPSESHMPQRAVGPATDGHARARTDRHGGRQRRRAGCTRGRSRCRCAH